MTSAMEAAMTDLMLGKTKFGAAFGATPMGGSVKKIADLLTKTMMPKVIAAHDADQKNLIRLVNEIKKCGSTKNSALKAAQPSTNKYNSMSSNHQKCRRDQAVRYSSWQACLAQQRALYNEKKLRCDYFASISKKFGEQKANRAVMQKAQNEKTEQYIVRISSTVCGRHIHGSKGQKSGKGGWGGGLANSMLDQYLRAKKKCNDATKRHADKVRECKRKHKAYLTKRAKCDQYQGLMDTNSCTSAVMIKDACEAYAGCYFAKRKAHSIFYRKAVMEEQDRKAEWRGLKRMDCLIKAFADGKVTGSEVDACKKQSHSTSHLTLKHPKIPDMVRCTTPTLYPATGDYKRKEFAPLPTLAKGKASAPCSGMATVPLSPRKGSPKGAKAERVSLNGFYSPGALIKVTNGHDVRRSFDVNSCPLGTKIFAPATRADWKTFFASASSLRDPHFIIDVTRPKNSCGGCRAPMNSQDRKQKTWVTTDESPWWLRSTGYGEPSGDYHANCFMNLGNTVNENTVTFNDYNCNYHSKSYYCQPMHIPLEPKKGSPRSCQCSRVDLSGSYSAGLLIKCEQCIAVSRSTQKNSCPNGMKIFSPASRSDWKTFLDSAGPLRAPHFIIDITRPQNRCGGCTRYPMNSKVAQQATWRTSDGSAWWLRSTRYNEPNGNYHGNCYLNINHNPTSPDTIRFDDHSCYWNSRSYYCQPTRKHHLYAFKGKAVKKIKTEPSWFCVANINKNFVHGPFPNIGSAKRDLNKMRGTSSNRQMICEMTASGSKKDPHFVGGQNQGLGAKGGFQKWWRNWGDIRSMNSMCARNSFCKKNRACDTAKEVLHDGHCYYLDGSNGKCDSGYKLAPQSVFKKISKGFVGKHYKNRVSRNCCIKHRDQKKERQDYGMPRNCNSPGPFKEGPRLGAIGCTNIDHHYDRQLTVCMSNSR